MELGLDCDLYVFIKFEEVKSLVSTWFILLWVELLKDCGQVNILIFNIL